MTTPDLAILLARLEVKLDTLLTESSDHELRLRRLEERRWPLHIVSVLFAVASLGVSVIGLGPVKV